MNNVQVNTNINNIHGSDINIRNKTDDHIGSNNIHCDREGGGGNIKGIRPLIMFVLIIHKTNRNSNISSSYKVVVE